MFRTAFLRWLCTGRGRPRSPKSREESGATALSSSHMEAWGWACSLRSPLRSYHPLKEVETSTVHVADRALKDSEQVT